MHKKEEKEQTLKADKGSFIEPVKGVKIMYSGSKIKILKAVKALQEVQDPEIGFDIINLGLVYEIHIKQNNECLIRFTFTTPLCPLGNLIMISIEKALEKAGFSPKLDLVFEPAWSIDKSSEEVKKFI